MKIQFALVFSVLATAAGFADVGDNITSLTTLSGKTYRGVLIAQVTSDGVLFRHANGAGKVLFSDLPGDVKQSLGYDPIKAESLEKEAAARRERAHLACIERDTEIAKAQAGASIAAASLGRVTQALYAVAASQQAASTGNDVMYPFVYGFGGYGWYTVRVPSPSYGGRAFYTVRRQVGPAGIGASSLIQGNMAAPNRCPPDNTHRTANITLMSGPGTNRSGGQPFSAGQITTGGPYSGASSSRTAFTNGVPALNSSFVPNRGVGRSR